MIYTNHIFIDVITSIKLILKSNSFGFENHPVMAVLRRVWERMNRPNFDHLEDVQHEFEGRLEVLLSSYRKTDIIELLEARGEEIDIHSQVGDRYRPLTYALVGGHLDVAKKFLDMGADPNIICECFGSPLTIAAGQDNDLFELLLEYGADLRLVIDTEGSKILGKAVKSFKISRISLCIEAGADINRKCMGGYTLLHKVLRCFRSGECNVSNEDLEQTDFVRG